LFKKYYDIQVNTSKEQGKAIKLTDKIGFVGAGNMAGAIIEGILTQKVSEAQNLGIIDISSEKCTRFKERGVNVFDTYKAIAKFSDIIFLAVKPQNYDEVLNALNGFTEGKIIVSIAAGISTGFVKSRLGGGSLVVRAMPNTPLLLGCGATALCHVSPVTDEQFDKVKRIFEAGGSVDVLPEDKMNAVISVNSSSPAYVYLFAKAVINGAVKQGIDAKTAAGLIAKTLEGSAKMIESSGYTPDELIKMVSSPGGTTLKALEALYEHDFVGAVIDAMERCTKRADELGK
jgi:pyrroline-5-carboxylate reductase